MGTMDCATFVELVTDFLEGALPEAEEERFVEHLTLCDGCETYLEQFRRTIDTLGELPADSLSAEARAKLLTAFRGFRRGE
ncbi:putative transmembrane anti-sigma factor [Catenulispora acidiphila DSM 44928]|uniref:Putative transmembrane anti-sigma factor n=1 Tax=Catenulispora acidiphila (strain DSM 44928 / JCM 14897 / NBRC 102108 / NRRL B-24433 / ID139908) TaxID=479433 RepID=C7Q7J0_CATAD|nr:putative transmembrane anti-sigma factor [Catenulispora acidiphila DSM 44928]